MQLPRLTPKTNTDADVWADTAYRSKANKRDIAERGFVSRIGRKKLPQASRCRAPSPAPTDKRSSVRGVVEHVSARQKGPMGLVVGTVGSDRATVKIGLADLVYAMNRVGGLDRSRVKPL